MGGEGEVVHHRLPGRPVTRLSGSNTAMSQRGRVALDAQIVNVALHDSRRD
jgi:hypothetical protein